MAFPLGIPDYGPNDRLGHQVAAILLAPSAVRDRLTAGIYTPSDPGEPLGRLDDALAKVIAAEAVEKKIRDAVKGKRIAAGSDGQQLQEAVQAGVIAAGEADMRRRRPGRPAGGNPGGRLPGRLLAQGRWP